MQTISIQTESKETETLWRAVAGDKESVGRTAGEALDALTPSVNAEDLSAIVVLRKILTPSTSRRDGLSLAQRFIAG